MDVVALSIALELHKSLIHVPTLATKPEVFVLLSQEIYFDTEVPCHPVSLEISMWQLHVIDPLIEAVGVSARALIISPPLIATKVKVPSKEPLTTLVVRCSLASAIFHTLRCVATLQASSFRIAIRPHRTCARGYCIDLWLRSWETSE
jgi:hypothetical protein